MAYEGAQLVFSMASSGNLSAKQYRLMKQTTAVGAVAMVTAATDDVLGVLQNVCTTGGGDAASICLFGITKAQKDSTGAAVTYGDPLVATTGGGVKTSTGAVTNYIVGQAMETMAAGTTGILTIFLNHAGKGSSGT